MNFNIQSKESEIFPKRQAPFRALGLNIAVMCYLATLALGGLLIAQRATTAWIGDVGREVTILLRPLEGIDIDAQVAKAALLVQATPGLKSVAILDKIAAAKLLEPWLGKDIASGLPLPRLITAQIDEGVKPDFAALERELSAHVQGASLDTHQRWQAEFASLGRGLILLASVVLALIALATAALVSFAARGVMDANKSVVETLQLIGAEPKFIARANDRQFLNMGLIAGGLGLGLGLASFVGLGFLSPEGQVGLAPTAQNLLFGRAFLLQTLSLMLLIPIIATFLALWTARFTLLRALASS